MRWIIRLRWLAVCWLVLGLAPAGRAGTDKLQIYKDRDCWVYAPDRVEPGKTYWLVVGVHGYRQQGKGAGGVASWVQSAQCIVAGPTFPSEGYQYLHQGAAEQLLEVHKTLAQRYKLHDKMFLHGYSGGSQFASRFAMKYPDRVIGCGAHSGGTWGEVDAKAVGVPLAISCGLKDTGKMHPSVPLSRLAWARKFDGMLKEAGFLYKSRYWPGAGHGGARRDAIALSKECFLLATTGLFSEQRAMVQARLIQLDLALRPAAPAEAVDKITQFLQSDWSPRAKPKKDSDGRLVNAYGWTATESADKTLAALRARYLAEQLRPRVAPLRKNLASAVGKLGAADPRRATLQGWLDKLDGLVPPGDVPSRRGKEGG